VLFQSHVDPMAYHGGFMNVFERFVHEENGVTAIEYGLIAALIAVGLIVLFQGAGGNLNLVYERIAACLVVPTPSSC
jgi:pilus assembly protein Flp/PilA